MSFLYSSESRSSRSRRRRWRRRRKRKRRGWKRMSRSNSSCCFCCVSGMTSTISYHYPCVIFIIRKQRNPPQEPNWLSATHSRPFVSASQRKSTQTGYNAEVSRSTVLNSHLSPKLSGIRNACTKISFVNTYLYVSWRLWSVLCDWYLIYSPHCMCCDRDREAKQGEKDTLRLSV